MLRTKTDERLDIHGTKVILISLYIHGLKIDVPSVEIHGPKIDGGIYFMDLQ